MIIPPSTHSSRRRQPLFGGCSRAFTLTELLVVIAIIAVLAGILIPVVGTIRDRAGTVQCQANLRSIYSALILYVNEHGDWLPPGPNPNGLTVSQHANYSSGIRNVMTTYLSPYMDLPVDNTQRVNPVFFCPGVSPLPATAMGFYDMRTYGIMASWQYGENYPFGYQNSILPKRMQEYLQDRNPDVAWVLRDIDQGLHNHPNVPAVKAHNGGRNYLFFSGSVKLLTEEDETELQNKIQSGGW